MSTLSRAGQEDVIHRIIGAAVLAPSAENTQPWQFIGSGDELFVCLDTTRTLASDVGNMLSFTALGAAIENAVIAASAAGFRCEVEQVSEASRELPHSSQPVIARLRLVKGGDRDPLAEFVESRCTSRRMDHRRRVDDAVLSELEESCSAFPDASVHWVAPQQLRQFSRLFGLANRIRLEHQSFHRELYDNLRFTSLEAEETRDGLDVATLQLPTGLSQILAALRAWPRMKLANTLGFSRFVARHMAREMYSSGAVGLLSVSNPDSDQFVQGGRALERMWLTATRLGLCFHPAAGVPVFLAHVRSGCQQLTPRHRQLATDISDEYNRLFPEQAGRALQMTFRIGYGPTPQLRSLRRHVEDVLRLR